MRLCRLLRAQGRERRAQDLELARRALQYSHRILHTQAQATQRRARGGTELGEVQAPARVEAAITDSGSKFLLDFGSIEWGVSD